MIGATPIRSRSNKLDFLRGTVHMHHVSPDKPCRLLNGKERLPVRLGSAADLLPIYVVSSLRAISGSLSPVCPSPSLRPPSSSRAPLWYPSPTVKKLRPLCRCKRLQRPAANDCKGQSACKGKGLFSMTKAECDRSKALRLKQARRADRGNQPKSGSYTAQSVAVSSPFGLSGDP